MTTKRDLKSIIRERQHKTGESYTAARVHVMRERAQRLGIPDEPHARLQAGEPHATEPPATEVEVVEPETTEPEITGPQIGQPQIPLEAAVLKIGTMSTARIRITTNTSGIRIPTRRCGARSPRSRAPGTRWMASPGEHFRIAISMTARPATRPSWQLLATSTVRASCSWRRCFVTCAVWMPMRTSETTCSIGRRSARSCITRSAYGLASCRCPQDSMVCFHGVASTIGRSCAACTDTPCVSGGSVAPTKPYGSLNASLRSTRTITRARDSAGTTRARARPGNKRKQRRIPSGQSEPRPFARRARSRRVHPLGVPSHQRPDGARSTSPHRVTAGDTELRESLS